MAVTGISHAYLMTRGMFRRGYVVPLPGDVGSDGFEQLARALDELLQSTVWQPAVANLDGGGPVAAVALHLRDKAAVDPVALLLDARVFGELKLLVDRDGTGSLERAPSITVRDIEHERQETYEAEALVGLLDIPPWLEPRCYTGVVEAHDGFIDIT